MKVAVVGAAGMLGAVTVREWREHGHDVTALTRADLDITRHDDVLRVLGALSPHVIINCTAYNRVDDAEGEPTLALAVNTWAVRSLARAAAETGAAFVHYSTDFVFDGETDRPYTEEDAPNPQSAYGMSKLLGEWMCLEVGRSGEAEVGRSGFELRQHERHPPVYVLRVESLFGGSASRSTIDTMLQNFASGRPVRAFSDRTVSPSHVGDIARATRALVGVGADAAAPFGVYHCVNTGMATWLEIAEHLRDWSGHGDAVIEPVLTTDVVLRAKRPRYCAMSNAKLQTAGIPMPTWQDALRAHLTRGAVG